MQFRTLGSTGLKISVVGIGTWQFGGEWGKDFAQEEVTAMLARGRELGINFIDTAECYGDHLSEALIGGAIAQRRADWIVATKFGHKYHAHMTRSEPRTAADVVKQLEASLKALKTDYIDIYQYHSWGNRDFDQTDVVETLKKQVEAGKVRFVGNSLASNDNLYQADKSTGYRISVLQLIYNRLDRAAERRVLDSAQRQNLGVLARVPLASGFLSGKYKPGDEFKPGDVRAGQSNSQRDDKLKLAQEILKNELPAGVNPAQWALAWCLKNPLITAVIPGCKSVEQVESNAAAAELKIP